MQLGMATDKGRATATFLERVGTPGLQVGTAIAIPYRNESVASTAASVHSRRKVLFTDVRRHPNQIKNIEVSLG